MTENTHRFRPSRFFKNRSWESVVSFNRGACARGGASHGFNSETGAASGEEWEAFRTAELTLGAALDGLRSFHRKAPFLFFNGNTFAEIGRQIALAVFRDLPTLRQKEVASAVAHYIAGVLDREFDGRHRRRTLPERRFPTRRPRSNAERHAARRRHPRLRRWTPRLAPGRRRRTRPGFASPESLRAEEAERPDATLPTLLPHRQHRFSAVFTELQGRATGVQEDG